MIGCAHWEDFLTVLPGILSMLHVTERQAEISHFKKIKTIKPKVYHLIDKNIHSVTLCFGVDCESYTRNIKGKNK